MLLLDVRERCVFSDYFLLCNAENDRQLRAMMRGILDSARESAEARPIATEGDPEGGWVLIDFGDVIVHLFSPERRRYYQLEDLWRDGRVVLRMQ